MRNVVAIVLAGLVFLFLTGMGGIGGQPPGKTPKASEEISAKLVDRQGMTIELTEFSMDGDAFITGDIGSGNLTVPMAKIKRIEFGTVRGEVVPVTLILVTGEPIELRLRKRADFFGNMSAGAYRVEASDVREITIH